MKLLLGAILGLTVSFGTDAQVTEIDSLISDRYSDEYMIRCFEGLTKSPVLDSIEAKLGFQLCSIASCVNPFSVAYFGGPNRELIKVRLKEIAERFVQEGTPVILVLGGLSGGDYAKAMNSEKNDHNIKFVSTGNYCEVSETENYFEYVFNKRTNSLLGLDERKKTRRKKASR